MSQVEWQEVKEVLYTALSRPPAERPGFLDSACGDNAALRSEVEVLLSSYESGFMESPLFAAGEKEAPPDKPLFEQGHTFSHYQILRLLGRGGMGEVYLANDTALDRLMAIKVIHGDSGYGSQAAQRLVREAKAAAKLDHPNICSVYEVGETNGEPFIAMQYVDGEMLDTIIGRGPIPFEDAVSYARQIAAALAKAHSLGIVHRDIKPSNVIVDARKHLKVLDFGLAKETSVNSEDAGLSTVGLIAGTVTYMSPEHARGQQVNGQTDIWSLGVVFYQMLTERLPFRGETKADLVAGILHEEVTPPSKLVEGLPPAVDYIISRALAKDQADRYAGVEEFDADLAELAETGSVSAAADFAEKQAAAIAAAATQERSARNYLFRYALPLLVLLVVFGGSFGVWRYRVAVAAARPFGVVSPANLAYETVFDVKRDVSGVVFDLRFSPDGSMIAFTLSTGLGEHIIYVQRLGGGEPVRLTNERVAITPVWSADGQRIAYISSKDRKRSIVWVPITGGEPTHLAELGPLPINDSLKRWSKDGKRIYLVHDDIPQTIDLETGLFSPIDLTGVEGKITRDFAVSADETRILAVARVEQGEKLWVKTIGANDARMLPGPPDYNGSPRWFPDNRRYVYSADQGGTDQIFIAGIDGGEPQQVTFERANSGEPAVSPDGSRIVYVSSVNEANLFATDIATRKETVITSKTRMQILPAVSPDGRRVAYQTVIDAAKLISGDLKIDSLDRADSTPGMSFSQPCFGARWSPPGNDIFCIRRAGGAFNIWKIGLKDQSELQVTSGGIAPPGIDVAPVAVQGGALDPSPDGSRIVFVSKRTGQENIWTAGSDGSGETAVTDFNDRNTKAISPYWSPAGDRIAFVEAAGAASAPMSTDNRIAIYKDGHTTIAGRFNSMVSLLGWSADGNGLFAAVAADRSYDIYFVPANGSVPVRKANLPNARNYSMKVSPDGRWVVYSDRRDDIDNLYIVPIDGGEPQRITANNDTKLYYSGVTWTPDSQTLVYSKQTGGLAISMVSDVRQELNR